MKYIFSTLIILFVVGKVFSQTVPVPNAIVSVAYACNSTTVTRQTAPPTGYDWYWQTSATGQSTILGLNAATAVTQNTTLYLRARSKSTLAWSTTSQTIGAITVEKTPPPAPTVAHNSHTFEGPVTISVDPVAGASSYAWYSQYNAVITGATTNTLSFPLLTTTAYFYAVSKNTCGESARFMVTATIEPTPVISGEKAIVMGEPVVLAVQNGTFTHYAWTRFGVAIPTDAASITVREPGDYKVTVTKDGVPGSATSAVTTVTVGATQNQNFVEERLVLRQGVVNTSQAELLPVEDVTVTTKYVDGLGRASQEVVARHSPAKTDLITPHAYDAYGRETDEYLPYVSDERSGTFKTTALAASYVNADQYKYYRNGPANVAKSLAPYARKTYEETPLNRVAQQGFPGEAWQPGAATQHAEVHAHAFNGTDEVIRFAYAAATQRVTRLGYYKKNQLYKTTTTDPQKNVVIEFSDKNENLVMRKVQAVANAQESIATQWAFTYYLYDDFGNLVLVLPPEAVKALLEISGK